MSKSLDKEHAGFEMTEKRDEAIRCVNEVSPSNVVQPIHDTRFSKVCEALGDELPGSIRKETHALDKSDQYDRDFATTGLT